MHTYHAMKLMKSIKPQLWSEVIELKSKDVKVEDEGDVGLDPTLSLEKYLRRYVLRYNGHV
jgi:hypothetical protein